MDPFRVSRRHATFHSPSLFNSRRNTFFSPLAGRPPAAPCFGRLHLTLFSCATVSLFFSASKLVPGFRIPRPRIPQPDYVRRQGWSSAVPQCGIPHPWSALNGNSAPIPHPVSHSGWVIGSRARSGSLRSVVKDSMLKRAIPLLSSPIYSQPGQKLEHPVLIVIKRTQRPVFRVACPHGRQLSKGILSALKTTPI